MLDTIFNKLIEYFPQIGGYSIVAIIVGFVVWKFTKFYTNTNKAIEKFPEIEKTLNNIDKGMTSLNQILIEKSIISQSCYSEENSPRAINSLGQELLKESGAEKLFESIKSDLITELEGKNFDSLLELERSSLQVLIEKMNDKEFKDLQNFAFEHPTFKEKPLVYTDILLVMSLKLRDAYREKYPSFGL